MLEMSGKEKKGLMGSEEGVSRGERLRRGELKDCGCDGQQQKITQQLLHAYNKQRALLSGYTIIKLRYFSSFVFIFIFIHEHQGFFEYL